MRRDILTAFSALGGISANQFKNLDLAAADADDRILYSKASGELFYDADGSGSDFAAIKFAEILNKATLTYEDFLIG